MVERNSTFAKSCVGCNDLHISFGAKLSLRIFFYLKHSNFLAKKDLN